MEEFCIVLENGFQSGSESILTYPLNKESNASQMHGNSVMLDLSTLAYDRKQDFTNDSWNYNGSIQFKKVCVKVLVLFPSAGQSPFTFMSSKCASLSSKKLQYALKYTPVVSNKFYFLLRRSIRVFPESQDGNDLNRFHHRYDLGRHIQCLMMVESIHIMAILRCWKNLLVAVIFQYFTIILIYFI